MYSTTSNRIAPNVTFAKKPVQTQSIWERYNYVKPIDVLFQKGKKGSVPDFVPA